MARWWIFTADPARYDLPRALNVLPEILWPVIGPAGAIGSGDTVMLWSDEPEPGIYGVATVAGPPSPSAGPELDPFWHTEPLWDVYCRLRVDRSLSAEPLLAGDLEQTGAIEALAAAHTPIVSVGEREQASLAEALAKRGWPAG